MDATAGTGMFPAAERPGMERNALEVVELHCTEVTGADDVGEHLSEPPTVLGATAVEVPVPLLATPPPPGARERPSPAAPAAE